MELTLDTPVRFIPRVGPAMATKLEHLGIYTARDFLYHIPFRYNDFSRVRPIARIEPGETVTVRGTVERFNAFATKSGKRVGEAKVRDASGVLSVIWFNQPYLRSVMKPGMIINLAGSVSWFGSKLVMNSPEYELFDHEVDSPSLHTGRIVPVYPATEGISSKWMRGRIAYILEQLAPLLKEHIPAHVLQFHGLMDLTGALRNIHFPSTPAGSEAARKRLAFDELFLLQLAAFQQKHERETTERAIRVKSDQNKLSEFHDALPFTLTGDQKTAIDAILKDLSRDFPMNRLLVGDVGSGKTIVAATAIYMAHLSGVRSVMMAPTQILASQHYESVRALLSPMKIRVELALGGDEVPRQNKKTQPHVIIGTHALLSDKRHLPDAGLIVIDEQHRFGVAQRTALIEKNKTGLFPHILTMTATPIPRTIAKTMMGHMDFSLLSQMPTGRKHIKTWVVPAHKRKNAYDWIAKQIRGSGGQVFIVCPIIEESESLTTVRAVKKEFELLGKIFRGFSLGLLHGRLKPKEKTDVLDAFRQKKHQILVTTPVVEVGIDIPNASIMLVEASDRFGLAQLHQLRGRVGRGTLTSYCLLFTDSDEEKTVARLKLLETESSGPSLAEADLALRGAGDILGTRQHGIPNLKVATFGDTDLIEAAQQSARDIITSDPTLTGFPLLREAGRKSTISAITED